MLLMASMGFKHKRVQIAFCAVLFCLSFVQLRADTLYWVGGSGTWSDTRHWSLNSGGEGGEQIPNSEIDVVFDAFSFDSSSQVTVMSGLHINSIHLNPSYSVVLFANKTSKIIVNREFSLAKNVQNEMAGSVFLLNKQSEEKLSVYAPGSFQEIRNNISQVKENIPVPLEVIDIDVVTVSQTCPESNDGSFEVTIADVNPQGPFAYYWTMNGCPGATGTRTNKVENVCKGAHSLLIVDSADMAPREFVVSMGPNPISTIITNSTDETCGGLNDGTITAFASGGTQPLQFQWTNGGGVGLNPTSLSPGVYVLTVTDFNGCVAPSNPSVTINSAPTIVVTPTITDIPTCSNSACSEDLVLEASGGNGPPFNWDNGNTATDMCPGDMFNSTVSDALGCTLPFSHTAAQIPPLNVVATEDKPVTCIGIDDGEASVLVTGGSGDFEYEWVGVSGDNTTAAMNGLSAGTYEILVTDVVTGCKVDAEVIITSPAERVVTGTAELTKSLNCLTGEDGEATVTGNGGTPDYTYTWLDLPGGPSVDQNVTGLIAGTYVVEITDNAGCIGAAELEVFPLVSINLVEKSDGTCGSECDGSAIVIGDGGSGGYVFDWYDMTGSPTVNPTNDTLTGICSGVYHIEVSDVNKEDNKNVCPDTLEIDIIEPTGAVVTVDRKKDNFCDGDCEGEIEITVSGGTLPYSADGWVDSAGFAPENIQLKSLASLCDGQYVYEVEDASGCLSREEISVSSPVLAFEFTTNDLCPGDEEATVRVAGSGGKEPHQIRWISDNITGEVTSDLQIGLKPDTYIIEVVDGNLCAKEFTFDLVIPDPIISNAVVTNALCQGVCDGEINVSISGGTGPYEKIWYDMDEQPTMEDLSDVCSGVYNMQIKDRNGCLDTLKGVEVLATTAVTAFSDEKQATCDGNCDGKVWVTASNGTANPNYSYNWFDAPPANVLADTANNMCVGTYKVEVLDQQGCIDTVEALVTAPEVVKGSFVNTVQNVCSQDCSGAAEFKVEGGAGTPSISWLNVSGNPETAAVSGLCNGSYRVQATDENNCQVLDTIEIFSAAGTVSFNTTDPSCGGYNDGSITATVIASPGDPQLLWLNVPGNPSSNMVSNLPQAKYELRMSDVNGCVDTFSVNLTDPYPPIDLQTDSQSVSCFGSCDGKAWATPTGGNAPFLYDWYAPAGTVNGLSPDTAIGLCTGTYFVAVVDDNLCRDTAIAAVTDPFSINLTGGAKSPCFGVCDGNVTAVVTGQGRPFTYSWNDAIGTADSVVVNACAGELKVKVSSSPEGCSLEESIILVENDEIILTSLDTSNTICTNVTNGSAEIVVSGGTSPYRYLWSDNSAYSSTIPNPSDLGIGRYDIKVTDDVGCTYDDFVIIEEVYEVKPDAGSDVELCEGDSAVLVGSGGLIYEWDTGDDEQSITVSPMLTTTYVLTVRNNVCEDKDEVIVTVFDNPSVTATSDKEVLLKGFNIKALLNVTGAGDDVIYDWNPPVGLSDPTSANPVATPQKNTRYYLTLTDQNGCQDTSSVPIKIIESIEYADGISPNGDGKNDDWPIIFIEYFPEAAVEIYNRWGQMLFHSDGYSQRWDGTFENEPLPVGTYYFLIDLGDDLPKYTGPITIFR